MDKFSLVILMSMTISISAWSLPYYPVPRAPLRITRFAPPPPPQPPFLIQVPVDHEPKQRQRPKRGHDYDDDRSSSGVTGPVHTFVKTDKNANYKWGVRHHVGDKYTS